MEAAIGGATGDQLIRHSQFELLSEVSDGLDDCAVFLGFNAACRVQNSPARFQAIRCCEQESELNSRQFFEVIQLNSPASIRTFSEYPSV